MRRGRRSGSAASSRRMRSAVAPISCRGWRTDDSGTTVAVAHLLETGRRRIVFAGGPFEIRQIADRLAGAREAVADVPGASLEVLPTDGLSVLEGRRIGEELAARGDRPDAVFAANDLVAVGVLQALVMSGRLVVPRDLALIGFDDIDFASAAVVPLSSVRQPSQLIGRTAVQLLIEEAADPGLSPRQVVFQPELVVRASTAPRSR